MSDISFLLLSCDKYQDLWYDFFRLKDLFWPDCPYKWTIVTEDADFYYPEISVLKCGTHLNWTGRLKYAIENLNTKHVCYFLDDFFINSRIDNQLIESLIAYANNEDIDYFVLGDAFSRKFHNPTYKAKWIIKIPTDREYGIDTSVAIWKSSFLLSIIGDKDCSAWQFEIDRLREAHLNIHNDKILLYDERKPLNVSDIPVVIQGKFYPKALRDFKRRGYNINTSKRPTMTLIETFKYDFKVWMSHIKTGRTFLKLIGKKIFKYEFFT